MTNQIKILAFAGSLREHALSKRVVKTAIKGAKRAGAQVTYIDLRDYPMPIYNLDDHEKNGFDEHALRLQGLFTQHDGFLIATPEYNGSLSAALKNAIDWVSRPERFVSPKRRLRRKIRGDDGIVSRVFGRCPLAISSSRGTYQYQR